MTYDQDREYRNGFAYGQSQIRAYGYATAQRVYRIAFVGTSMSDDFKEGFAHALASVDPVTLRVVA